MKSQRQATPPIILYKLSNGRTGHQYMMDSIFQETMPPTLCGTAQDSKAHFVLVNGIESRTGAYTLTLKKRDNLGDLIQAAGSLPLSERLEGELTFDDAADWYRLQVPEGQRPAISLEYLPSQVTDVSLYDSDGTAMKRCQIEGSSRDAKYQFLTERPGAYYLSLAEYIAYGDSSPSYAVTYMTTSTDDKFACS